MYRMALGMIEQHRAIAFGGIEIARPKGDRACRLAQDAAKGQELSDGVPSSMLGSTTRSACSANPCSQSMRD
jgi:hypothetical protein